MAWTQDDINALKAAIVAGRGARSITFADQSVTFHSIDEMLKLLAVMEQEANVSTRRGHRLAATSKGV